VGNGIFVLILSTLLFVLLRRLPSSGQRIILPLVLGTVGLFFIAPNNPYLVVLAYWAIPACFLNAAVSILERTGAIFKTYAIAGGSFFVYLYSAYLGLKVMVLFSNLDASLVSRNAYLFQTFLLLVFSLFFSLILFYCVAFLPVFWKNPPQADQHDTTPDTPVTVRTAIDIPGKKWGIFFISSLLLVITISLILLFIGNVIDGTCSGYECGVLSVKNLGDIEPDGGKVIHLTDEKIREFPQLGVALKTGETRLPSCSMEFRMGDTGFFNATTYLEYQGTFYNAQILHYAGYECRKGISFTAVEQ
jgi:hypothetical protein